MGASQCRRGWVVATEQADWPIVLCKKDWIEAGSAVVAG